MKFCFLFLKVENEEKKDKKKEKKIYYMQNKWALVLYFLEVQRKQ